MPKSKRNKQVELAKTKKRGLEWKKKLFQEIRTAVDSYSNAFVFSVTDMRNSKMKSVRDQWKDSRFFIGKNKIMAMALGRFAEEEYKPNLHKLGQRIKGQRALLFSNRSTEDVLCWFRSYSEGDFARSGNSATQDVKLLEGPLPQFPHSLEPYLRQLGLPTSLVKGVIHLVKDHEVCKEGDSLTPETAKIVKLLGYEMAEFHITINCMWSQDGTFMQLVEDEEPESTKENKKKRRQRKSNSIVVDKTSEVVNDEEMEVEEEGMSDSSEHEIPELVYITPKATVQKSEIVVSPTKASNKNANTSTPKDKIEDSSESNKNLDECAIFSAVKEIELPAVTPITRRNRKAGKPLQNVDGKKEETNNRQSRARKRQVEENTALKQDAILMTPDIANSSQDSPVFRELRNRSVKVNKKKNRKH